MLAKPNSLLRYLHMWLASLSGDFVLVSFYGVFGGYCFGTQSLEGWDDYVSQYV